jgi:putative Mg2+ transporter-C (MgtC) family protein
MSQKGADKMELREVTYLAVALRVAAAFVIGGLLGWERGVKNRAAGLRTHMLVCVGACLIMLTNQFIYQVFHTGDPVRMGAQVVSGIGFLGAGTIIVTRRSQIKGLTTAAGLWTAAGVGLALGIGFYEAAIVSAIAVILVMTLMQRLDTQVHRKTKTIDVYLELEQGYTLGDFLRATREQGIGVFDLEKDSINEQHTGIPTYMATLKPNKRRVQTEVVEELMQLPCISYMYIV